MTSALIAAAPPGARPVGDPLIFEAKLTPHRALSARGFRGLAVALVAAAAMAAVPLAARGLWPVLPFMAGDIAFLLIVIHRHSADRGRSEHIRVDRDGVVVAAFDRRARLVSESALPLYGLTLERDTDPDFGLRALRLSLRGRALEIARDLAPAEKAAFADAFENALGAAGCRPWRRDRAAPALSRRR